MNNPKCLIRTTLLLAGMTLTAASADAATLHFGDRHYLAKTTQGMMSEIQLGRMAEQQGGDARIKAFGRRMVIDHSKDLAKLRQIAATGGVRLPVRPTVGQRFDARRLARLTGANFDRAYINHEVRAHRSDIRDARREARGGKDASVRQFASNALPELNAHLRMAQQIAGR